jgi:16S rRNA (cytosine967-C5)-methyltransferase
LVKSRTVSPARLIAFEILQRVSDGAYASVLLAAREPELSQADRGLCHELVMGVLRWQLWLDRLIESYSNRKVSDLDEGVRLALRLGLYQLRFLSRIPASAAVNESVSLTSVARLRSAGAFVNAVLRRATREPEVDPADHIEDSLERLAVVTSHPRWLIARWQAAFGAAETEALAHANNLRPPIAFRVVKKRARETEICDDLRKAGATIVPSKVAPGAWRIGGATNRLHELVARGEVYIQDEASQLVATLLDLRLGQRVLDLCAAPGGKTTQIADLSLDANEVVAGDLHERRLQTIKATARLQGLESINCIALDATQSLPLAEAAFDRVLVDAPCSGTGTLRHNPEIRWRISESDVGELAERQKRILTNAAKVVRPGGRLVYSTCSVEWDEGEEVARWLLETHESFRPVDLPATAASKSRSGSVRLWPHRQGTDGFFICAMERH